MNSVYAKYAGYSDRTQNLVQYVKLDIAIDKNITGTCILTGDDIE